MNLSIHLRFRKVILLSLFILMLAASNPSASANYVNNLEVDITDAWYADGEGDGKDNDIFVITKFKIQSPHSQDRVDYDITLITPSGQSDTYTVTFFTSSTFVEIRNNFWNHATESGWYTVTITAELNQNGEFISDTMVFDPPGGDNADPKGFDTDTTSP